MSFTRLISFLYSLGFTVLLGIVLTNCATAQTQNPVKTDRAVADASTTNISPVLEVFLVRHAEKVLSGDDPALTKAGQARAILLADMLKDAKITSIHSSDYKRTRHTAAPLSQRLGLNVQIYDPRDLSTLAQSLKSKGGRHLIVGHSNTTPQLVELLGGDGGAPIVEAYEYDRLYVVTALPEGETTTSLLRFGQTIGELKGEAVL